MKALKFLFSFLIISLFVIGAALAQDNNNGKTEFSNTFDVTEINCVDEPVTGQIEYCGTMFKNAKVQEKWKGTLIGDITGDVFTVSQVLNNNWKHPVDGNAAWTQSRVWTFSVYNETMGMEVAVIHALYHVTYSNGGLTVEIDNWFSECY
jgi:hypothetical protein